MRKTVIDSSFSLLISVIVIVFIVTIGFFEINTYLNSRDNQVFINDCGNIISTFHYLAESNSLGSFTQVNLRLPINQSLIFNNETNTIQLNGSLNQELDSGVDIMNYLEVNAEGDYRITVCYYCNLTKDYLVVIN